MVEVNLFQAILRQIIVMGQGFKIEPSKLEGVQIRTRELPGFPLVHHTQTAKINQGTKFQGDLSFIDPFNIYGENDIFKPTIGENFLKKQLKTLK